MKQKKAAAEVIPMRRWWSLTRPQFWEMMQMMAARRAPPDRQKNTKQQSVSGTLASEARKGMRGPMMPLTMPLMRKEKVQIKRYSQSFHIIIIMVKDLRNLFKVPKFYLHFCITSIIYLILPNLIFKVYPPHSNEMLLHRHMWFLNFDGIHYFNNHYDYEPNHAFLPLYVKLVQTFISLFGEPAAVAFLILINKLAFLVAASDLNIILKNLFADQYAKLGQEGHRNRFSPETMVRFGLLFFLYNPAGIFFNVIYTESLFCLLTFRAIRYMLQDSSPVASTSLMTLSVAIRSNGMFLVPVVGLQILYNFANNIRKDISVSLKAFLKGIAIIASLVTPFILHNVFTFLNFCEWGNHRSDMCERSFFGFYGAVQERYWNVGFLKYFTSGNLLFIIIGTPAVIVAFLGLFYYSKTFNLRQKGLYLSFFVLFVITVLFTNIQSSTRFFCSHPYFYYAMACLSVKLGLVKLWAVFYWIVGIFMYVVGFPWT